MQFVGIFIVTAAWLILAMLITGYEKYVKLRSIVAMSIVPLLTLPLIFTNESHGLIWSGAALNVTDPGLPLEITYNSGYYVLVMLYSYALMLVGVTLIIQRLIASRRSFRTVGVLMLLASTVPWAANVVDVYYPSLLMHFDPTSLLICVGGLVLLWRLVYMPFANILPVAHEVVVDSIDDAIIVLDGQNRIVDANPKALGLFQRTLGQATGYPIEKAWSQWPTLREELDSETVRGNEVNLDNGSEQ